MPKMGKCKTCEDDATLGYDICYACLKKERDILLDRIQFAMEYLPESPNKAMAFLKPATEGGD